MMFSFILLTHTIMSTFYTNLTLSALSAPFHTTGTQTEKRPLSGPGSVRN